MTVVKSNDILGTGRRKTSVARVRIRPGEGKIRINNRELEEYFQNTRQRNAVVAPLEQTGKRGQFDVTIRVDGGGISGVALQPGRLRLVGRLGLVIGRDDVCAGGGQCPDRSGAQTAGRTGDHRAASFQRTAHRANGSDPAAACLTITVTVGRGTVGVNRRVFEKHCASSTLRKIDTVRTA